MACTLATQSPKVLNDDQMVVKAILCHPILQFISHLIFIFMNINNIFRNRGKNAESIRWYTRKNVHIMLIDRHRELKLVSKNCLNIVL